MPRISDAPRTSGRTGIASSSRITATPEASASSLQMVATPPRVASRMNRVDGAASSSRPTSSVSGAVSERRSDSMPSSPRASMMVIPWSPIGPETITASPGRAAETDSRTGALQHADPRRVDEAGIGLAALHHLGVAGHDLHPRPLGGGGHRGDDPAQVGDREPLLEHESRREVERPRPRHRQVVDGAVHGQVADVAAGEEERRDHVGVGGEGEPRRPDGEDRLVLQGLQQRVAEGVEEEGLDQGVGGLAPRAVREGDQLVGDLGGAPADPLDPLQDLLLGALGHAELACLTLNRVNRPKL